MEEPDVKSHVEAEKSANVTNQLFQALGKSKNEGISRKELMDGVAHRPTIRTILTQDEALKGLTKPRSFQSAFADISGDPVSPISAEQLESYLSTSTSSLSTDPEKTALTMRTHQSRLTQPSKQLEPVQAKAHKVHKLDAFASLKTLDRQQEDHQLNAFASLKTFNNDNQPAFDLHGKVNNRNPGDVLFSASAPETKRPIPRHSFQEDTPVPILAGEATPSPPKLEIKGDPVDFAVQVVAKSKIWIRSLVTQHPQSRKQVEVAEYVDQLCQVMELLVSDLQSARHLGQFKKQENASFQAQLEQLQLRHASELEHERRRSKKVKEECKKLISGAMELLFEDT